ncbi:MAG: glycosyltransferase family 2 protein [Steroidobacteraceae bacterium]
MRAAPRVVDRVFSPCAVIPVFDHEQTIAHVLAAVRASDLTCLLVDDGSGTACARELDRLAREVPGATLIRLAPNRGKGAAVLAGFRAAAAKGHTHALQIDADGQHALADIPRFVAEAREHPTSLICGRPLFDASMPRLRRYGRWLTHALVWLETLSFEIPDSLCGFRVYPLQAVMRLATAEHIGTRMDFDVEILVRLHWRGVPLRWLATRVVYPLDGVSHFRLVRDNAYMVLLQLRLLAGMLLRLPRLIGRKLA